MNLGFSYCAIIIIPLANHNTLDHTTHCYYLFYGLAVLTNNHYNLKPSI